MGARTVPRPAGVLLVSRGRGALKPVRAWLEGMKHVAGFLALSELLPAVLVWRELGPVLRYRVEQLLRWHRLGQAAATRWRFGFRPPEPGEGWVADALYSWNARCLRTWASADNVVHDHELVDR